VSTTDPARTSLAPAQLLVRGLIALALLVDAVVHLHLAPGYQLSAPSGVGAGNLFRLEAAAAIAAAVLVVVRANRAAYAAASVVALSALAAVLLYRYVNVPALGPLPAMYEPLGSPEKILSAGAEAFADVVAMAMLPRRSGQLAGPPASPPTPSSEVPEGLVEAERPKRDHASPSRDSWGHNGTCPQVKRR